MLVNRSIRAPWAIDPPEGAASLSACKAKNRNAAVEIAIHLILKVIRRLAAIQAGHASNGLSNWMRNKASAGLLSFRAEPLGDGQLFGWSNHGHVVTALGL